MSTVPVDCARTGAPSTEQVGQSAAAVQATVQQSETDRLTVEVTVHKAVHPALFAALREVDRRQRAERLRLLGTRGLLAEQHPHAAVAGSVSRTSLSSHGATAGLAAHASRAPDSGDADRRRSSAVVDSDVESVFR